MSFFIKNEGLVKLRKNKQKYGIFSNILFICVPWFMAHGSWLLVAHGHDPWRFLFPDSNPEAQLRGVFLIRQTLLSHSDHEAQPWGDPKARILEAFRLTFRGCGGRAPTTHPTSTSGVEVARPGISRGSCHRAFCQRALPRSPRAWKLVMHA